MDLRYLEYSIEIDAPVKKAFQYVTDWQNMPEYDPAVVDLHPASEIAREKGAKFIMTVKPLGVKTSADLEVQEYIENERVVLVSEQAFGRKIDFKFEKIEDKTRLTYGMYYRLPWFLSGILAKFSRTQVERAVRDKCQKIKAQVEAL